MSGHQCEGTGCKKNLKMAAQIHEMFIAGKVFGEKEAVVAIAKILTSTERETILKRLGKQAQPAQSAMQRFRERLGSK